MAFDLVNLITRKSIINILLIVDEWRCHSRDQNNEVQGSLEIVD